MNTKKIVRLGIVVLMVALIPLNVAYAGNDNGNNGNGNGGGNDEPEDPGVSGGQTVIRTESAMWVLPHGDTFIINGQEVNIVEDWGTIEITSRRVVGNGGVVFVGIGGSSGDGDFEDFINGDCGSGNGVGGCNNNGNGNDNGNGGGGGGPLPHSDCGGLWVTPGEIFATGRQIAPTNAVVTGQDPNDTGVTVEWNIRIEPTTVIYERWQLIGHRHVACVEGDLSENGNGNIYDTGGEDCPHGWHSVIEHIWGCVGNEQYYREDISQLNAEAILSSASRSWIQGELAAAYPSATLLHPDWTFSQNPNCTWVGDVCYWNFTANIPAEDPGWYDIKVSGLTGGTLAFAPRDFSLNVGEFGVYLIDNTALTQ